MRLSKPIRWMAAVCAVVVATVLFTATPASATTLWWSGVFFGSTNTAFHYQILSEDDVVFGQALPYYTVVGGRLYLDAGATVSATDCKMVTWETLDFDGGNTWDSPKVTDDCQIAIDYRNQWFSWSGDGWLTSANQARGNLCVYLYYNHSTTYGWSRCETGAYVIGH
jgi:hypothetical protein